MKTCCCGRSTVCLRLSCIHPHTRRSRIISTVSGLIALAIVAWLFTLPAHGTTPAAHAAMAEAGHSSPTAHEAPHAATEHDAPASTVTGEPGEWQTYSGEAGAPATMLRAPPPKPVQAEASCEEQYALFADYSPVDRLAVIIFLCATGFMVALAIVLKAYEWLR